ncbi:MAG: c-type cytochrome biogenesis protein CcmF [Burkholderiales bacterium 35-55-47]|jgi:cytochrome c-type biogenesis protein CcmF|uniref:heme lyase CcmF/NrfE family subunit n=1 Tax=Limnohabitans sp. TaxID=1907725 RepID=UPI000BDBC69D|nr:heme lyase CcmF/NrfE family subunit [Limnohabitans sp.]OYY20224.1 MAG: c-type cytochrome biogenesis protein CcmF [Burkholderiales bacterium 35-55-47]OYZ74164.1 MAG: c-type cytochrome biogenesis protein CcmF [Burkholderiales bacterium 24-55-52]OZB01944.1 MAG: c-type cytochrome biogenesis protein CcmF [Burkholderiales bacterium 39-55-53]HQR86472.1 heme lyase CcmF/NrfE family subunit [Limnohabitans sp.]HQS25611.1 heme lyase CcmF/NrfE family subunit [Limnohabitans sp.]
MIPELGNFALMLAALVALMQGVFPIAGTLVRSPQTQITLQSLARPTAALQFVLVAFAFGALATSFLNNDFSVLYVSQHSNSLLPKPYQFAAVWGGHEGSLLLWVLLLALWSVAVAIFSRSLPLDMVARVIGVLGLISVGFLLFILTTSNPFERLLPAAMDGKDLNPLLQDPGLVIHPPMLYMGYVGMAVAFAFAVSALMSGRLDAAWARWSRPWTVVAWAFLTFGIGLGSWWAYYELGWGGWWFWDPVENASLMPWLVGTALIHSLMVTEKRGSFKAWTVLLAIAAFSLSLLGTFLVRSGVLTSVHAFASDPKRGVFILIFLAVVVGASLTLFAWRAPRVALGGRMELVSRESFLLANSVLLVVATAAVLLGTIYPLIIDALNMGKLSVGPPYFNAVFAPLLVPTVFLMIPGSVARWRDANVREIAHKLRWTFAGALVLAVLLPFVLGGWSIGAAFGLFLGCWVALGTAQQVLERLRKPGRIGASFWGQHTAHLGMAVLVIGITGVKCYEVERDVRMRIGDVVTIAPYTFRLNSLDEVRGPNYKAVRADVQVLRDDKILEILQPEKRRYFSSAMAMTEAGIDSGFMRDLYVSLGEPLDEAQTEWSMRVYYKPFVPWLWGGVLLMVLGGVFAALDRRYRK